MLQLLGISSATVQSITCLHTSIFEYYNFAYIYPDPVSEISQFHLRRVFAATSLLTWAPTCSRVDLESPNNLLAVPMHSRRKGLKQHHILCHISQSDQHPRFFLLVLRRNMIHTASTHWHWRPHWPTSIVSDLKIEYHCKTSQCSIFKAGSISYLTISQNKSFNRCHRLNFLLNLICSFASNFRNFELDTTISLKKNCWLKTWQFCSSWIVKDSFI